jgi:hypothetical protein
VSAPAAIVHGGTNLSVRSQIFLEKYFKEECSMDKILNVAEAARELGMSERWLRHSEETGKIPKACKVMPEIKMRVIKYVTG